MLEIDPKEIIINVHKDLITKLSLQHCLQLQKIENVKKKKKKDYLNKLRPININYGVIYIYL